MSESEMSKLLTEKSEISPKQDDCAFKIDFMPSLQKMAMTAIVTNLWANKHIQNEITDISPTILYLRMSSACWKRVEKNVLSKVSQIPIAKPLRNKLSSIVRGIGKEIFRWIIYYDNYLFKNAAPYPENSAASLINCIHWDFRRGKIDYAKTARNILSNLHTGLNEGQKYLLACDCCFADEIPTIAPNVVHLNLVSIDDYPMVHFWTEKIRSGNVNVSDCKAILQNLILHNNGYCNDVSLIHIWKEFQMHIWETFSDEEKYETTRLIVETSCSQELKWSLLSALNSEQQRNFLKECPNYILNGVLNAWQWREYFSPLSLHVLDFIRSSSFISLLEIILIKKSKISPKENSYMYNQYKSFFKTIWLNASNMLKNYFFRTSYKDEILLYLLCWIRDRDIVALLFKDMYALQWTYSPLRGTCVRYCFFLILSEQWDLLEQFIMFAFFPQKYLRHLNQNPFKEKTETEEEKCVNFPEVRCKIYEWNKRNMELLIENPQFRENPKHARCVRIFRWLYRKTKADFVALEEHFEWCFVKNLKEVWIDYDFPEFAAWLLMILKLVEEDKYELLYEKVNMKSSTDDKYIRMQDE